MELEILEPTTLKIKVGGLGGFGLKVISFEVKPGGRYEVSHTPYSFNPLSVSEIDIL